MRKVNKPLILSDLREFRPRLLEDVSRLTLRWSRERGGEKWGVKSIPIEGFTVFHVH